MARFWQYQGRADVIAPPTAAVGPSAGWMGQPSEPAPRRRAPITEAFIAVAIFTVPVPVGWNVQTPDLKPRPKLDQGFVAGVESALLTLPAPSFGWSGQVPDPRPRPKADPGFITGIEASLLVLPAPSFGWYSQAIDLKPVRRNDLSFVTGIEAALLVLPPPNFGWYGQSRDPAPRRAAAPPLDPTTPFLPVTTTTASAGWQMQWPEAPRRRAPGAESFFMLPQAEATAAAAPNYGWYGLLPDPLPRARHQPVDAPAWPAVVPAQAALPTWGFDIQQMAAPFRRRYDLSYWVDHISRTPHPFGWYLQSTDLPPRRKPAMQADASLVLLPVAVAAPSSGWQQQATEPPKRKPLPVESFFMVVQLELTEASAPNFGWYMPTNEIRYGRKVFADVQPVVVIASVSFFVGRIFAKNDMLGMPTVTNELLRPRY